MLAISTSPVERPFSCAPLKTTIVDWKRTPFAFAKSRCVSKSTTNAVAFANFFSFTRD